ncbi:MAG TPA: DNA polymerase I [Candidatus Angelobacter sp.]|nr:DNA polymerase I [Candidatus Angelobacter sp.]
MSTNGKAAHSGRVYLMDAMSFIFRAYHAMTRQRPMSTKTGVPTAATYVFVNMLRKLRADFHPEYLAAVFDVAGPTFRDEQAKAVTSIKKFDIKTQTFQETAYHGYKANRAEMPQDLAQQVPYIRRALEAYRIPILELPGFEADDVIGTLARKAAEQGHEVFVVSNDKDMLQLVSDRIRVLNPPKDNLLCDAAKVEELLGVRPEQVIDVMALRGDSIDNIPGAPGIGDKGSVELIKRFGTLENTLEHAAEVERKTYRESLLNNQETILWSKQLVTIDQNAGIELELKQMITGEPDTDALRALFSELEFTTLLKELAPAQEVHETEYRELNSAEELKALEGAQTPLAIAFDFAAAAKASVAEEEQEAPREQKTGNLFAPPEETSKANADADKPLQVGLSTGPGKAFTASLDGDKLSTEVKRVVGDPGIPKAVHDYKAALRELAAHDAALAGVRDEPMLYSYLINPTYSNHSLGEIAVRSFNLKLSGSLAEAADVTGRASALLRQEIEASDSGLLELYQRIDLPLVPVLARMEEAGVRINTEILHELSVRLDGECAVKAREIHEKSGVEFNINSPKQLGEVLFNKLNLPRPMKYGKGKTISTAVDVLEELSESHEVPRLVLEYRQLAKLKSTYVDSLPALLNPATLRLHTTFNQTGTATGRLSSTNPNLQNIPIRTELGREIRAAFVAAPGCVLLSADYSQIELRLLAHFSEDPLLVEAFRRGDDIHSLTASQVFGVPQEMVDAEHRRRAKAVNFGIVYGLSPFGLSQQLGIEQKEAKKFIDAYFEKYQGVRKFIDQTLEETRREQKVRTLFGRVRPIPDINSKNANMRGFAERTAVNTPLQGTAADLIKLAMIRIDEELRTRKLKSRMLLQVHDDLLFEVPETELETMHRLVRENMENVYSLKVPLLVEAGAGPNWRDAK